MRFNNGNGYKFFMLFTYYPIIYIDKGGLFLAFLWVFKRNYLNHRIVPNNFMRLTHKEDHEDCLRY